MPREKTSLKIKIFEPNKRPSRKWKILRFVQRERGENVLKTTWNYPHKTAWASMAFTKSRPLNLAILIHTRKTLELGYNDLCYTWTRCIANTVQDLEKYPIQTCCWSSSPRLSKFHYFEIISPCSIIISFSHGSIFKAHECPYWNLPMKDDVPAAPGNWPRPVKTFHTYPKANYLWRITCLRLHIHLTLPKPVFPFRPGVCE